MTIECLKSGMLTTVQDSGRFGYGAMGFSPAGAADQFSFQLANLLVGNALDTAALEFTLLGPELKILEPCVAAWVGAPMDTRCDGRILRGNRAYVFHGGEVLSFGYMKTGIRAYFALAGGLQVPLVLGSASTYLKCGIGGFEGRALRKGDLLEGKSPQRLLSKMDKRHFFWADGYTPRTKFTLAGGEIPSLRYVRGPQQERFEKKDYEQLQTCCFRISQAADRMAVRLEGMPLCMSHGTDIISDGIGAGAIQISSNGLPIVMLCDRQTTGGYAKIGTVISSDLPILAQCRPGELVRFEEVSVKEGAWWYRHNARKMQKLSGRWTL